MSNDYIESDNDLFGLDIPTIDPPSEMFVSEETVASNPSNFLDVMQDNMIVSYSVIAFVAVLILILLIAAIKKLISVSKNPMAEYTKMHTKRAKQQAYVSSSNKLETPANLADCIRIFLERTK